MLHLLTRTAREQYAPRRNSQGQGGSSRPVLVDHALRHGAWHLRMARHGVALRFGRFVAVLLICAALGAALGHAIVGRGTRPDEEDDAATEES
jgi:hypothetical protein